MRLGAWVATLRQVKRALTKAGLTVLAASEADWIDEAVWLGDTTLVGVSEGRVFVLTRGDDEDEEQGAWDEVDDDLIRTVRRLVLRDALARTLGAHVLTAEDVAWALRQAELLREPGYVAPSGRPGVDAS